MLLNLPTKSIVTAAVYIKLPSRNKINCRQALDAKDVGELPEVVFIYSVAWLFTPWPDYLHRSVTLYRTGLFIWWGGCLYRDVTVYSGTWPFTAWCNCLYRNVTVYIVTGLLLPWRDFYTVPWLIIPFTSSSWWTMDGQLTIHVLEFT